MSGLAFSQEAIRLQVVTESWAPFNYMDEDGVIKGESTETVIAVLERANIEYSLKLYPWVRSYKLATEQPNVLLYSIYRTPIREKKFHWICPLRPSVPSFIYKLSSRDDITFSSLEDIRKYRFAVNEDSHAHQLLESKGFIANKDFALTPDTSYYLKLLLRNRVDFIVENEPGMKRELAIEGLPENHTTQLTKLYEEELCMALSLQTPQETVEKVRKAFIEVKKMSDKKAAQ